MCSALSPYSGWRPLICIIFSHMLHITSHYLSRHTAPRLKSSWVVFQPGTSSAAPSLRVRSSNLSVSASDTAASASAGAILNRSCPRRPSVRWYVSLRQPAFEMTTLNSSGRMGLKLDKDTGLPYRGLHLNISIFCRIEMWKTKEVFKMVTNQTFSKVISANKPKASNYRLNWNFCCYRFGCRQHCCQQSQNSLSGAFSKHVFL